MGLDLQLLPFEMMLDEQLADPPFSFAHSVLACEREYDFFNCLQDKCEIGKVPETFYSFVGRDEKKELQCYGPTQVTAYGEPLMFTTVARIIEVTAHYKIRQRRNRAVMAYLRELPLTNKIALYWH